MQTKQKGRTRRLKRFAFEIYELKEHLKQENKSKQLWLIKEQKLFS